MSPEIVTVEESYHDEPSPTVIVPRLGPVLSIPIKIVSVAVSPELS